MSYYSDKRRALLEITQMAKKGNSILEIIDVISLRYGFGKKIVKDRLTVMQQLGHIDILDGEVVPL